MKCVCMRVCNIFLLVFKYTWDSFFFAPILCPRPPPHSPYYLDTRRVFAPTNPILTSPTVVCLPSLSAISCIPLSRVLPPALIPVALYPLHNTSRIFTAPYAISGLWKIYVSLSLVPQRRRVLDLTTASDILDLTKPHIYEYSRFRLLLRIKAKRLCVTTTPIPGMMSVDYTIWVKIRLHSWQGWRYLSLFSFSTVSRSFIGVCHR